MNLQDFKKNHLQTIEDIAKKKTLTDLEEYSQRWEDRRKKQILTIKDEMTYDILKYRKLRKQRKNNNTLYGGQQSANGNQQSANSQQRNANFNL